MNIVIIGAGNAGRHLATTLAVQQHNVTVIDNNPDRLAELEHLDVLTVEGSGADPSTLEKAEISKADLLVAVSGTDEVNILACAYARAAGVRGRVARINNSQFTDPDCRIKLSDLGVDLAVSHKEATAEEIFNILRLPGSHEVVYLLGGKVITLGIKISTTSPLITAPLKSVPSQDHLQTMRFIGVVRGDDFFIPDGNTQFMIGDDVYVVIMPDQVDSFLDWACPERAKFQKVIVGGGGEMGLLLAQKLEAAGMKTVLIEANEDRAEACSQVLNKTMVLHGDLLDKETLAEANIEENTAFVAVTGDDENNIISCLLAEQEGASWTLAEVSKPEYVPVINSLSLLDRGVSPHASLTSAILHFVRGRNASRSTLLHNLPGELLEITLRSGSPFVSAAIREVPLPSGSIIATIRRGNEIFAATGESKLLAGDVLVIFCLPKATKKLEALFKE